MNIQIMETTEPIYRVVLEHPEYGIERHEVAVAADYNICNDEECAEFNETLLDMLEQRFNRYHIFHEMHVYADYYIDGKMYTAEVKRRDER